jgi:hypothetical protein
VIDKTYMTRHLTIDRYLQGKLSEDEVAEFESRLVWDQELGEELDLAEQLRLGLQRVSADGDVSLDHPGTGIARLRAMVTTTRMAVAASFLLGIMVTSLMMTNLQGTDAGTDPQLFAVSSVPLEGSRSGGPTSAVEVPFRTDGLTVLLVAVAMEHKSYRVSIRRSDATEAFMTREGLVPGATLELEIGITGQSMADGMYFLAVEGATESGFEFIREFPFQAVISE